MKRVAIAALSGALLLSQPVCAGTLIDLSADASRPAANDQVRAAVFSEASGANLQIPAQAGRRFQPKLDSNSKASWTLIPAQAGQPKVIT